MRARVTEAGHATARRHSVGSAALSIALHVLVVWSLLVTAGQVAEQPRPVAPGPMVWIPRQTDRAARPSQAMAGPAALPLGADRLLRGTPLPIGRIPDGIPAIEDAPFDPRAFGAGDVTPLGAPAGDGGAPLGTVYETHVVDEPPERLAGPPVRYPPLLRASGLEGRAVVEVVIDTAGHPEPGSLVIVETTHALFAAEARAVVLGSLYRPGRLHGRPVRVLIRQPVTFRLTP